jgi:membrane peptidoglycan carboxypeptidase
VFLFFVIAVFGVYQYLASSTTIPAALDSATYQNTTVYYSDGKTVIGTIGPINRQDLTFSEIPTNLQNAVLAAEDKDFWTEGGISPTGILRAAIDDVTSSGSLSGGSTITQEFVRNYYTTLSLNQTVSRKVREIFIAQKLASSKSKQWILTNYLNLIYLGDQSYGVAAAAQTYFGLPVSKLSISQDAVIAAIIQQPSNYPLIQYRQDLIGRWQSVLGNMVKDKFITQAQLDAAKFPEILTDFVSRSGGEAMGYQASNSDPWAPYIMDVVYNELTDVDHVSVQTLDTGGLKVVTTISLPLEREMYNAVDENIAAIKATPGAEFPSYVRIGAELQNPSNGQILAMYPGPGQSMSAKHCAEQNCDVNTAVYAREQVGSSFKPYVLSAAVADGMNVQTSILNSSPYLWVPPDTEPMTLSATSASKAGPEYYPVSNDGGEQIGKQVGPSAENLWESGVQNALAQSSNTAFTDLAHRVGTDAIIKMAQAYGVNIAAYPDGSGLTDDVGQVATVALGASSLTVNEQTQMLATIDDNGVYHAGHVIKYWQLPDGPEQAPDVQANVVLTPAQDSQVQYAMEMTTVDGTGTAAAAGLGDRPIIGKTGTTTNSHSGFFIGAIPQYALVVGMFTQSQAVNSPESLALLTGGGFGGYWPAKIWNTFALAEFANLPYEYFQNPVFTGSEWNQIGKLPKKKKKVTKGDCTVTIHGKKFPVTGKNCPTKTPTPTPTPTRSGFPMPTHSQPGGGPTSTPTTQPTFPIGFPTPTATPTPTPTTVPTGTQTATPAPTPTSTLLKPGGFGRNGVRGAKAASGVQAGLAVGGALLVLPGSLLWTTMSRRRRKRRAGAAE